MFEYLKKTSAPLYIVSPHLDDAVLSCGQLLLQLKGKKKVTIVNVFTKAHTGSYTISAKKFLHSSKYKNAEDLFKERVREDKRALSKLNVTIVNIGLTDALFRRKEKTNFLSFIPALSHIYPTYRFHILGNVSPIDPAARILKSRLQKIIPQGAIVFAPVNIGGHVDHEIVKNVCEALFDRTILYSDFPYNIRYSTYGMPVGKKKETIQVDKPKKDELILSYRTQISGLFANSDIPKHKEVYFYKEL